MTKGAVDTDGTADKPERAATQRITADMAAQADSPATYGCAQQHVTGQQALRQPMLNIYTSPSAMARTSTSFRILLVQPMRGYKQRQSLSGTRLQLAGVEDGRSILYLQLARAHPGETAALQWRNVNLDHLLLAKCAVGPVNLSQAAMVTPLCVSSLAPHVD